MRIALNSVLRSSAAAAAAADLDGGSAAAERRRRHRPLRMAPLDTDPSVPHSNRTRLAPNASSTWPSTVTIRRNGPVQTQSKATASSQTRARTAGSSHTPAPREPGRTDHAPSPAPHRRSANRAFPRNAPDASSRRQRGHLTSCQQEIPGSTSTRPSKGVPL